MTKKAIHKKLVRTVEYAVSLDEKLEGKEPKTEEERGYVREKLRSFAELIIDMEQYILNALPVLEASAPFWAYSLRAAANIVEDVGGDIYETVYRDIEELMNCVSLKTSAMKGDIENE